MDVALECAQCRRPVTGGRFCTSCGVPLPGEGGSPRSGPLPSPGGPGPLDPNQHRWDVPQPPTAPQHASADGWTVGAPPPAVDPAGTAAPPWLAPPSDPPPARSRPNILALLVLAALVLSGWAIVRGVEEHTLSGSLTVVDSTYSRHDPGESCTGRSGYSDIGAGAQVVVTDGKGSTLSTGRLSAGEFDGLGCVFSFALEDVIRADFYVLTVASEHRGEMQYSYKELAGDNWTVSLSLGDD